jgi:hypothetical protein
MTTEKDGTFTFEDVPAGDYAVRTQVRGQGAASAKVTVAAGKTVDVVLTLKPNEQSELTPEKQARREARKQERKQAKKALKNRPQ